VVALMLLSACTSQVLSEDEAGDRDDDRWEANTADSCCVMIESDSMTNGISLYRD
jgi:hypothetical protein